MKSNRLYLEHILACIHRIELYSEGGEQVFLKNIQVQDAIYRNFEIIGEASKRVPESIKAKTPNVPWKSIAGFRDVLIHQYDGVDPAEVWGVIQDFMPALKNAVQLLLETEVK
jgi:uncharacterized protein with HEPN domain